MQSLECSLKKIIGSLPENPIEKTTLDELVSNTLNETPPASSPDNRRVQWEYILRNEVFSLAVGKITPSFLSYHNTFCGK